MKKEIADKWVKALRSNDYKQGKYLLRDKDNNFCCLGVLCDLAVKEGIIPSANCNENDDGYSYSGVMQILPGEVRNWAEIYSFNGQHSEYDWFVLSQMNDSGKSFEEIATSIENNIEFL